MARRRRIEAPSEAELAALGQDIPAERPVPSGPGFAAKPPIATIAGEAAAMSDPGGPDLALDRADAEAMRRSRAEGWAVVEIPVDRIRTDAMARDRMSMDGEEMEELRASIRANGLRMPIEVVARGDGTFDLISGLRRMTAMRDVAGQGAAIRAFVRPATTDAETITAMVEENEVRADLTPYERGRAAVMAVEAGAFESVEDAVARIFASASKAKRSKVRGFALIHEGLGDMLAFPQALTERQGLRLASALRQGHGAALRQALGTGHGIDEAAEWSLLEAVLREAEAEEAPSRTRRAREPGKPSARGRVDLANGISIRHVIDSRGHSIRVDGRVVDTQMIELIMAEIERLLEPI